MGSAPRERSASARSRGQLLDAFLQLSPDATLVVDGEGVIRAANDLAAAMFGYAASELSGQRIELLVPERLRAVHERQRDAYLAAPRTRAMGAGLELAGRRKDGSEFPADISLSPLGGEHTAGLVVAAIRDVSQQRRRERLVARLAAIVRSSDAAMLSTTPERVIDSWNPAAEAMFGYPADEVLGRSLDVLIPDDARADVAALYDGLSAGEHVVLVDTWRLHKDGRQIPVAATISVMRDEDTRLIGFSEVLRDMTERRRTQAELAAAHGERQLLADRERIARDLHDIVVQRIFAAGMAIQSATTAVTDSAVTGRLNRAVSELDTAVHDIRTSIFTLRRDPADTASLRGRLLDIGTQMRDALGFLPAFHFDGLVDLVIGEHVADHLYAVVHEALANIAKHAHATTASITVTADQRQVSLVISDNGQGIRESGRRSGLDNLQQRAAELGGTFEVRSTPDAGTHLLWTVPLH
jgi:PAS domain S-box-containing protein